ncbi:OLC1v1013872C1 [Oldenlandia corymbosa var. corymbosa]|uniref:OLC1v1013872C1 n=1 Tax=Oldenlandia corymbosa var. corymbosa TaxID=529605 RepID=A0AAV1E083_OLDCO|nr:OLC1v1013872C1 [Oldenlandia corymbosa var. corymbosa]
MMEFGSGGSGSGHGGHLHHHHHHQHHHDDDASPDPQGGGRNYNDDKKKKKRYHRHTAHQIQRLESMFKECPHPDEKTRLQLSRELNLAPRQIKFWFQNRRTQMKAQHERADNCALRAENDKIRCENIAIREALKNVICPSCGGPPVSEDPYFDEQKLRMENAQLKDELDRVSSIAAKYIGRPISQLPPVQPIHISSLDLSMSTTFGGGHHGMVNVGPSLDFDLLPGSSSAAMIPGGLPFPTPMGYNISDMDKSLMGDIAANAMDELIRLLQSNEPLWIKSSVDGRELLNLESYEKIFPRANTRLKNPNTRIEASRDSGVVIMNALALVDMFMDVNKWVELFPTIVSRARTIDVISSGILGNHSGTLQLMYEELQVLSPFVPPRELYFLRFCQQIEQGSWAIVDVSYELPQDIQFPSPGKTYRLPSGCLIQDMPNGYSKVTWVEHLEMEEKAPVHRLFRDVIQNGLAFGAERWLASLQRMCERFACLMVTNTSTRDLGAVISSAEGRRSMMKLAQRMVRSFCASINPSNGQWSQVSGLNEFEVRATLHRSTDPGQPNVVFLSAATTIWLPIPPHHVFNFFRDERTRPQWDVLSHQNPVQEVSHIANGSHPGNCISVLRAFNTSQNNRSESSSSSSIMDGVGGGGGASTSSAALLALEGGGGSSNDGGGGGNRSAAESGSGGSLITVVLQIHVSNLPSAKMSQESVNTVNSLISTTVHQIKAALNCTTTNATTTTNTTSL